MERHIFETTFNFKICFLFPSDEFSCIVSISGRKTKLGNTDAISIKFTRYITYTYHL